MDSILNIKSESHVLIVVQEHPLLIKFKNQNEQHIRKLSTRLIFLEPLNYPREVTNHSSKEES